MRAWEAVAACLLTLWAAWILFTWPGLSAKNALRLWPGMSEAEVEAILGGPGIPSFVSDRKKEYAKEWGQQQVTVLVLFSSHDRKMITGRLKLESRHCQLQCPLGPASYGYEPSLAERIEVWLVGW